MDTEKEAAPPAPTWSPEIGDELRGTFLGLVTVTGRHEKPHQIAIIEDLSGTRYSIWCSSKMLWPEMKRADPRPGEAITIRRLEDRDTGKPHPLKVFKVVLGTGITVRPHEPTEI